MSISTTNQIADPISGPRAVTPSRAASDTSAFAEAIDRPDDHDITATVWRRHPLLMAIRNLRRRPPQPSQPPTSSRSELLARLRSMPIGTWTYGWEGTDSHHIGPMAQDFWDTFGFGTSDRRIDMGDSVGICMAAICELADRIELLERRLAERDDEPAAVGHPS